MSSTDYLCRRAVHDRTMQSARQSTLHLGLLQDSAVSDLVCGRWGFTAQLDRILTAENLNACLVALQGGSISWAPAPHNDPYLCLQAQSILGAASFT